MQCLKQSTEEHKTVHMPTASLQSHEKFIERLKTFDLYKWFAKPSSYSPILCAKYGWFNYSQNTLKCVSCGNLFYVYTPKNQRLNKSVEEEKVDTLKLVDNHNLNCPWRIVSVPDSLIEVDVFDRSKAFSLFMKYKASFDNCKHLAIIDDTVDGRFADLGSVQQQDRLIHLSAVCGWLYIENLDVLKCEKCLRTVGLWLFECVFYENENEVASEIKSVLDKMINSVEFSNENYYYYEYSKPVDSSSSIVLSNKRKLHETDCDESSKSKRMKRKLFNPIEQHYSWCPWLKVVNREKRLTACQVNNQIIVNLTRGLVENKTAKTITDARIKSVQSLITNCASVCSLNSD